MLKRFLKEEKAQGAIEYILLAGGIIVAAVVIFVIYKNIAQTTGEAAEATTETAALKTACESAQEMNITATGFNTRYAAQNWTASDCNQFGITLP